MNHVDTALSQFKADDYTVRITNAIFNTVPFAPRIVPYSTVREAAQVLYPQGGAQVAARAEQIAAGDEVKTALWVANAIDTGDTGIAIYSGMKSALGFFFGNDRKEALETDPQQGVDAALKLLGIGYMAYSLFPGSVAERAQYFHTTPAGQALELYFGAVEVALPFADNLVTGGGDFLQQLMQKYGADAQSKLGGILGGGALQHASGMLGSLMGPVGGIVAKVGPYATTIAETAKNYVPGFMAGADKVAGVVATGADTLPVYNYLGARLAAEGCVLIASRGG
jgi:hypothetical protein